MYVPPYEVILNAIGVNRGDVEAGKPVTMPAGLFKLILEAAVSHSEFEETTYLKKNPDVKEAIGKGRVPNARWHYAGFGYFENRQGGTPAVNEDWYLMTYGDVASAIATGKVRSATEHFETTGIKESRAPRAELVLDAQRWKGAVSKG